MLTMNGDTVSEEFRDLVNNLLAFDPNERLTIEQI